MAYGYFLAILAASLWGLNYCLDQKALTAFSVIKVYFLHSLFGVFVALILWVILRRPLSDLVSPNSSVLDFRILLITLIVGTAAGLVILASIQQLNATRASILEISYPLFVALFSYLLFGQALNTAVFVGGSLMIVGAGIIVTWS